MIRRPWCTIHGWCISHFCPISGNMLLQPWQHDPSLLLSQHQFLLRQPRVFHWIELIKLLNWKQEVGIGNNARLVNVRSFTHWKALDKHVSPCGNSLLKDTLFRNLALPIGKPKTNTSPHRATILGLLSRICSLKHLILCSFRKRRYRSYLSQGLLTLWTISLHNSGWDFSAREMHKLHWSGPFVEQQKHICPIWNRYCPLLRCFLGTIGTDLLSSSFPK